MPEFYESLFRHLESDPFDPLALTSSLAFACLVGAMIASSYRWSRGSSRPPNPVFEVTLVLLTLLICLVTQVIGNNVARAFSLVGALSIVRFRTVVDDTLDIAFVMFAVVVGMAMGAGLNFAAILGTLVTGVVSIGLCRKLNPILTSSPMPVRVGKVRIRLSAGNGLENLLKPVFEQQLQGWQLASLETVRSGTAVDLSYRVTLLDHVNPFDLVAALTACEGVQSVEWGTKAFEENK